MRDVPGVPSAAELERLPHGELAALLAEAYRVIGQLQARVEELERQARRDSSTSSRPPSSDSPYKKKPRDRSLRERGKRSPGKQPGQPGTMMRLVDDPDERVECPPACCRGCGAGLAGQPVLAWRRHQVTDIAPPPPPRVTEYVAQSRACPSCGTVSEGELPWHARARASYGPEAHAQAASLACGHHVPVWRSTALLCQLSGLRASTGWVAGIRGKAAALVTASGFAERARDLLRAAPALHADETPARAAGGLRYVHLACTSYLTWMHTGDRSAAAISAGGILPGYDGIIVRDGYKGYSHLTDALHAWCGAHLLRDLQDVHDAEPALQQWAGKMGCLLPWARDHAAAARHAGKAALDPEVLDQLTTWYRAITAEGQAASQYRHQSANDRAARALARRFTTYEDMILRFATRPVKVQQRTSGGCWRTLQGLADFAIVESYLSTASKWGIPAIDALRGLFNGNPWIPPALQPSG